jgi:hypothetical protein
VRCHSCDRVYDDAECWTICPHGPLWAGVSAYCPLHDLVHCPNHPPTRGPDGCYGLFTVDDAALLGGVKVFLDGVELTETFCADDRQGWVARYCDSPPATHPDRPDDVRTEVLVGRVRIERKGAAA